MRLSESEITGIISALETFSISNHAELRLYGSRTDNTKKGGDIDLLLMVSESAQKNYFTEIKYKLLAQIK